MTELGPRRQLPRGEDTDLLCVELCSSDQPPVPPVLLPRVSWDGSDERPQEEKEKLEQEGTSKVVLMSNPDQGHEDFLTSVLLKTDAYRPLTTSLRCMEDPDFLDMRGAVVNWFAKVSISYNFDNETVVAALSHFDRYVSLTVTPVNEHVLLQLAAYVALLIASKMSETCPLRMKSLANLTGRMFTPLQVKRLEMDMISKLNFRLAPPSADETLHSIFSLLHTSAGDTRCRGRASLPSGAVPPSVILSTSSYYLKKARARTCWFRHSPYTLAVAALATAYNSLGLGSLRRRLLKDCDARVRGVTGQGIEIHAVAACADAMDADERAAAAAAATASLKRGAARCSTESPVCGGGCGGSETVKEGWGSPTGVAQGAAELLQKVAYAAVGSTDFVRGSHVEGVRSGGGGGGVPLVEEFDPPRTFSPCGGAVPTKAVASYVVTAPRLIRRVSTSPRNIAAPVVAGVGGDGWSAAAAGGGLRCVTVAPQRPYVEQQLEGAPHQRRCSSGGGGGGGQKRRLHQSVGSCFEPCARRRSVEGHVGRRLDINDVRQPCAEEKPSDEDVRRCRDPSAGQGQGGGYAGLPATSEQHQRQQQEKTKHQHERELGREERHFWPSVSAS